MTVGIIGEKIVVVSSLGPIYVVNASRKEKDKELKLGTYVALNERTKAIMDILPITKEELIEVKKHIFLGFRIPENEP